MNIAIFSDIFLEVTGGIPNSIRAQKASLEKMGHQVLVFCPAKHSSLDPTIIVVPTLKRFSAAGAPVARRVKIVQKFVKQYFINHNFTPDIIHAHYEGSVSIAAAHLARDLKIPFVQTMHGREDMALELNIPAGLKIITAGLFNELHRQGTKTSRDSAKIDFKKLQDLDHLAPTRARALMWQLMVRQANLADLVLAPSGHFRDKLIKMGTKSPVKVLSNGVPDHKAIYRHRTYDPAIPLKIVWNSRLSKEKRILPFLKTVKILNQKYGKDRCAVDIFGDGNAEFSAKAYAKRHSLTNVKFHGKVSQSELFTALDSSHLSVMMSYGFDTQGLTLLESGAIGLPVVYSDPDMNEVCLPGAGLCAKNSSPAAMAELIGQILDNPTQISNLSAAAKKHHSRTLQSTQTKHLLEFYRSLL